MSAVLQRHDNGPILVFLLGSLGDTVVVLPTLHGIRRRNPNAHIALLTNTPVDGGLKAASSIQILQGSGLIDDALEYPHGRGSAGALFRLVRAVRTLAPRVGFYLTQRRTPAQLARDRLFFALCGIRTMHGLHSRRVEYIQPTGGGAGALWESEAHRVRRAIGFGDAPLRAEDFSLNLSDLEKRFAVEFLRSSGVRGQFVAASVGTKVPVKDWGEDHWERLLSMLASRSPLLDLVLIGSSDEFERSARLARHWSGRSINLCGRLSPRQSAAVLQRARVFVGHDSGPMHLAAAVGTPTVAVFAAREMPGVWFPFGQEHNVFYRDVPCRDCRLDMCHEHGQRCLREIDPADVAARINGLLQQGGRVMPLRAVGA